MWRTSDSRTGDGFLKPKETVWKTNYINMTYRKGKYHKKKAEDVNHWYTNAQQKEKLI